MLFRSLWLKALAFGTDGWGRTITLCPVWTAHRLLCYIGISK